MAEQEERSRSHLRISGFVFIKEFLALMCVWRKPRDVVNRYVEKVLHAVFFFGKVHRIPVAPSEFLEPSLCTALQARFPRPFDQCGTHLPSMTPYSILLEFGTKEAGCSTKEKMEAFLIKFNEALQKAMEDGTPALKPSEFTFRAAVVAHSFYSDVQEGTGSPLFFGASLSCKGRVEREIMISVSCMRTWHKAVAFAVYNAKYGLAVVFPDGVQSRAFWYHKGEFKEKQPCLICNKMFQNVDFRPPLDDAKKPLWPHGNCAENESLSNLLLGVQGLQERVVSTHASLTPNTYMSIEQNFTAFMEEDFRNRLIQLLQESNFPHQSLQFFEHE
ncbi:uncharacterized protein [Struthio camelus]